MKRVLVFCLLVACIILLSLCFQKTVMEPEAKPEVAVEQGTVGLLFAIYKRSTVYEDHFDTVGKPRYLTIGDVEYVIGGPTDFNFPERHPEVNVFLEFGDDIQSVLDTLKILD